MFTNILDNGDLRIFFGNTLQKFVGVIEEDDLISSNLPKRKDNIIIQRKKRTRNGFWLDV